MESADLDMIAALSSQITDLSTHTAIRPTHAGLFISAPCSDVTRR